MKYVILSLAGLVMLTGCMNKSVTVEKGVAVILPAGNSQVMGKLILSTMPGGGVHIQGAVSNLSPGQHGFHIHEWGDISAPDGTSAGGHYNPQGHPHAGPEMIKRHEGDLGNILAGTNGIALIDFMDKELELNGPLSVIGRGVIIHAQADDLQTQPTGNAGGRIGMGVIGIAKP